ncbi:hypothetical protein FHS43_005503 [Streptosporangium becharense]|uniref:Uncharacterized protein n=1 Tax=Streptosporangium becharense TaxID=1816182 RepID=A0A7W9IAR2_9ACTN|nr:hypothetical protein [Streptosporangium becharense]MBB2914191.1 hypothetical protein [Streptosporangium becharense]MBB5817218.1 hypothetical protein [Streptosporangium becharense]
MAAGPLTGNDRPTDPYRCRMLEIGLARRKVELYERMLTELPDAPQTLEVPGRRTRPPGRADRPPVTP